MAKPTKTINRLHFEDLDPMHFERLGFEIIRNEFEWVRLDHTGALGNDGGVDILGKTMGGITYYCQVKRYQNLRPCQISEIISKIVENNEIVANAGLILFLGCDLSADSIQKVYLDAEAHGIKVVNLYTAIKIEALLYDKYHILLEKYFGIIPHGTTNATTKSLINKSIARKKQVQKLLLRKDLNKSYDQGLIASNPEMCFITDEFVLLSAKSLLLPERYGEDSSFCRVWPQRFLDEGIEVKVPAFQSIAFNVETRKWRKVASVTDCKTNEHIVDHCQVVWLLPFYEIKSIEPNGDSYFNEPIIICESDFLYDGIIKETYSFNAANIIFDEQNQLSPKEEEILIAHIKINIKPYDKREFQ